MAEDGNTAKARTGRFASALIATAIFLLMPLWLPITLVSNLRNQGRMRRAAQTFACLNCGQLLGTEALQQADLAWQAQLNEFRQANPGVKPRMARTLDAVCPQCAAQYTYRSKDRTFFVRKAAAKAAVE